MIDRVNSLVTRKCICCKGLSRELFLIQRKANYWLSGSKLEAAGKEPESGICREIGVRISDFLLMVEEVKNSFYLKKG